MASRRWRELEDERKQYWNQKASKKEKPALDDLTESQRKKLIDGVLHRIDDEVHISTNKLCPCNLVLYLASNVDTRLELSQIIMACCKM